MIVLGIETSCDETSLSIINEDNNMLSNVIVSQHSTHSPHGGIIPELASRQHILNIEEAFENCLLESNVKVNDISTIGVTNGPGLIGSLIVGVNFAKGLSIASNIPLVGVNHLKAHVFASWIKKDLQTNKTFEVPKQFPLMCIIVSGGHTDLVKLDSNYKDTYYPKPIARNVIPLAGNLTDNGYSDEEMKFVNESRKILGIPNLIVEPSNARVGVRTGHGTFCSAVFENEIDLEECSNLLNNFEGVEVWNDSLPTPIDVEGKNEVLISRLRQGLSSKNILNFWVVSDNLLKGAALNAVQIAKFVEKL